MAATGADKTEFAWRGPRAFADAQGLGEAVDVWAGAALSASEKARGRRDGQSESQHYSC